jgi:hypothetical protein
MAVAFDQLLNDLRDLVEEQNAIWHADPEDETHDAIEEKFRADLEMGMAIISQSVRYIAKSGNIDALASVGLLKTALDDVAYPINSFHVAPTFFDVLSDHFQMTEDLYGYAHSCGGISGPINHKLLRSAIQHVRRPFKSIQTALTDKHPIVYFKTLSVSLQALKPVTEADHAVLVSRFFTPLAQLLKGKLTIEEGVMEMAKLIPVLEPHLAALLNYSPKMPKDVDEFDRSHQVNMTLGLPVDFWASLFEKTGNPTIHQVIETAMFFPEGERDLERWGHFGFTKPQAWHTDMQQFSHIRNLKQFWQYAIETEGVDLCRSSIHIDSDPKIDKAMELLIEGRMDTIESRRKGMVLLDALVIRFPGVKGLRERVLKSEIQPVLLQQHPDLLADRFTDDLGM